MTDLKDDPSDNVPKPTGFENRDDCGCLWQEWTDGNTKWEIKIYDCGDHPDSGHKE